jgi:hypothetical protein
MRVTTSSGCTARQVDSKSKSSGAAAYSSSTDSVPAGEPSMQTMCSMGAPLARMRSTYCSSQIATLVPALSNR